jgi:hypothetical protein
MIVDFHNALSKVPIINNIVFDISSIVPTHNKSRQSAVLDIIKKNELKNMK